MKESFRMCFDQMLHFASEVNVESGRIADGRQQWRNDIDQPSETVRVSNENVNYSSRHLRRLDGTWLELLGDVDW